MKSFIVSIDADATKEARDQFTAELTAASGVEVWHHIATTWIIRDVRQSGFTAASLRDRLRELMPKAYIVVFELEHHPGYAMYGPIEGNKWVREKFHKNPTASS